MAEAREQRFLTIAELSAVTGIAASTLYDQAHRNTLRGAVRSGGRVVVDYEAWRVAQAAPAPGPCPHEPLIEALTGIGGLLLEREMEREPKGPRAAQARAFLRQLTEAAGSLGMDGSALPPTAAKGAA